MKILKIISEAAETYDYGCIMLMFDSPNLLKIQDAIDPNHIVKDLKTDFHCTLLYGIHDDEVGDDKIEEILHNYTFSTCKIYNISCFENDEYDILKLDVEGENLSNANTEFKTLPHTNEYTEFRPHITIAYLEKGMGDEYVNKFKKYVDSGYFLSPQYAIYSKPSGERKKMNIGID